MYNSWITNRIMEKIGDLITDKNQAHQILEKEFNHYFIIAYSSDDILETSHQIDMHLNEKRAKNVIDELNESDHDGVWDILYETIYEIVDNEHEDMSDCEKSMLELKGMAEKETSNVSN